MRCPKRVKTALKGPKNHFRITPINGHRRSRSACLKRATKRLMHRSNYRCYSITSARASSEGVLRPSAFGSNRFPDEDVLT
jgi:hypothetical protein